jgi:hypothetical protein
VRGRRDGHRDWTVAWGPSEAFSSGPKLRVRSQPTTFSALSVAADIVAFEHGLGAESVDLGA